MGTLKTSYSVFDNHFIYKCRGYSDTAISCYNPWCLAYISHNSMVNFNERKQQGKRSSLTNVIQILALPYFNHLFGTLGS